MFEKHASLGFPLNHSRNQINLDKLCGLCNEFIKENICSECNIQLWVSHVASQLQSGHKFGHKDGLQIGNRQ